MIVILPVSTTAQSLTGTQAEGAGQEMRLKLQPVRRIVARDLKRREAGGGA
jgi:hypothetical protein